MEKAVSYHIQAFKAHTKCSARTQTVEDSRCDENVFVFDQTLSESNCRICLRHCGDGRGSLSESQRVTMMMQSISIVIKYVLHWQQRVLFHNSFCLVDGEKVSQHSSQALRRSELPAAF
jgi:hypothetical protein